MNKSKIAITIALISLFLALLFLGVGKLFQKIESEERNRKNVDYEYQITDNTNKTDNTKKTDNIIIIDNVKTDNI